MNRFVLRRILVLVALFLVVGFNWPSTHAQSISISVEYPRQTVATDVGSTRIVVTASYSGLQSGYRILVILMDAQRVESGTYSGAEVALEGTAEASPYSCITLAENDTTRGKAICEVYPAESSGFVRVVFEVTERRFGTWGVLVTASISPPTSSQDVAFTSSDISLFMVYIPFPILVGAVALVTVAAYILQRRGRKLAPAEVSGGPAHAIRVVQTETAAPEISKPKQKKSASEKRRRKRQGRRRTRSVKSSRSASKAQP